MVLLPLPQLLLSAFSGPHEAAPWFSFSAPYLAQYTSQLLHKHGLYDYVISVCASPPTTPLDPELPEHRIQVCLLSTAGTTLEPGADGYITALVCSG